MAYEHGDPACCILEICCGGERQVEMLATQLHARVAGISRSEAQRVAAFLIETYDFAPVGSLRALKREIAKLAREYPPDPGY